MNPRVAWVAARRFRSHFLRGNAFGKILIDPAYAFVGQRISGSVLPLLDIGCGAGFLASYLRAAGHQTPILGLDADAEKVLHAQVALGRLNCRFTAGDALDLPLHSGDIVMLDVIHYFDAPSQRRLIDAIAQRIAPGGMALVRLTFRDGSWRFRATRAEEWFVSSSGWIPFRGNHFPTREEILSMVGSAGLSAAIFPMWGLTPFNSYMLELRRPRA